MTNSVFNRFARFAITTLVLVPATTTVSAQQGAIYEIVSSFESADGRPIGVIQARDGLFYGVTAGGPTQGGGIRGQSGTVFAMDAAGARTRLHVFTFDASVSNFDGTPGSNLLEGTDGNLYGTTYNLASSPIDPGQIFRITTAGAYTRLTGLFEMRAGLIQARDGSLYGTQDGTHQASFPTHGTVYRIDTNNTLTVIHRFDGSDTAYPVAEVVEAADGSLWGTTTGGIVFTANPPPRVPGAIFRISPITGGYQLRHVFPEGTRPIGRLIQGTDGVFYGTTINGGAFGQGTVFALDGAGHFTTLHSFAGDDGASPNAGVIQGRDGRFYGTTTNGGAFGQGTVFVMTVTGAVTTLHDFTLADGANPNTELIQATDGALYGAAPNGGPNDSGVVFRIRLATVVPGGYFEIVSRNSGKCLDIFGASTDAAAPAIQWTCHGGPNQQWRAEPLDNGAFRLVARHSEQALDVYGAFVDDLTPLIQYPPHGGDNQAWTIEPASDGYVRLVVRHSGKAMDVEGASTDEGARVIQYTPHGGANQQWLLRPAGSGSSTP